MKLQSLWRTILLLVWQGQIKQLVKKIINAKQRKYSSSIVLNVLGMQIYRIFLFWLLRFLHVPKRISPLYKKELKALEREGVLAIPNFFSKEVHAHIQEQYKKLSPSFALSNPRLLPHVEILSLHDNRVSPKTRDLFLKNKFISEISRAYLNRDCHLPLPVAMTKIYCTESELDLPRHGGTNNIHIDTPTRTLKMFYYVNGVGKYEGPFCYCRGSNKRTSLKRLFLEYKLSIRYALNRFNTNHCGEYEDGEPWVKLTDREIKKYRIVVTPVLSNANTLVIVDTGGWHKRGENRTTKPRETIQINYLSVGTINNETYPWRQFFWKLTKRLA